MNFWLSAYIVLFVAMSTAGIWADIKSKYSLWWVLLDTFGAVALTVGMILSTPQLHLESWKAVWQPVAVSAVLATLGVMILDIYDEQRQEPEEVKLHVTAAIVVLLLDIPAFAINLAWAFIT